MKNLTKEQISSLVRHIISLVAGILIAKGILVSGATLAVVGASLSIVSIIWSIRDKTYTLGQIEGTVRQVLTAFGGFVAFQAYLTPTNIEIWVSLITSILPTILGQTDKLWSQDSKPVVESLK